MTARIATVDDLDWIVATLKVRRGPLVEHAPVSRARSATSDDPEQEAT